MQLFCGWENFSLSPSTRRPLGQERVCAFYKDWRSDRIMWLHDHIKKINHENLAWFQKVIDNLESWINAWINSYITTWRQMGGWWAWCWVCRLPPCTVSIWTGSPRLVINIIMIIIIFLIIISFVNIFHAIKMFCPPGERSTSGVEQNQKQWTVQ